MEQWNVMSCSVSCWNLDTSYSQQIPALSLVSGMSCHWIWHETEMYEKTVVFCPVSNYLHSEKGTCLLTNNSCCLSSTMSWAVLVLTTLTHNNHSWLPVSQRTVNRWGTFSVSPLIAALRCCHGKSMLWHRSSRCHLVAHFTVIRLHFCDFVIWLLC